METPTRKPLLILDLDHTLLFASDRPFARPADLTFGPYFIYDRPHLREFLTFVTTRFRPAIWSASHPSFVEPLASHLFPDLTPLAFIWTRDQCSNRYDLGALHHTPVKDLRRLIPLSENLAHILHLSMTPPPNSRPHPNSAANLLPIPPFEGDPKDTLLLHLIDYLTQVTAAPAQPDFRSLALRQWQSVQPQ